MNPQICMTRFIITVDLIRREYGNRVIYSNLFKRVSAAVNKLTSNFLLIRFFWILKWLSIFDLLLIPPGSRTCISEGREEGKSSNNHFPFSHCFPSGNPIPTHFPLSLSLSFPSFFSSQANSRFKEGTDEVTVASFPPLSYCIRAGWEAISIR